MKDACFTTKSNLSVTFGDSSPNKGANLNRDQLKNKLSDSLFFARHVVSSKKVLYLSPDRGANLHRDQLKNKLGDSLLFVRHAVPSKRVLYLSPDRGANLNW
jgi:hypothetical protein